MGCGYLRMSAKWDTDRKRALDEDFGMSSGSTFALALIRGVLLMVFVFLVTPGQGWGTRFTASFLLIAVFFVSSLLEEN